MPTLTGELITRAARVLYERHRMRHDLAWQDLDRPERAAYHADVIAVVLALDPRGENIGAADGADRRSP